MLSEGLLACKKKLPEEGSNPYIQSQNLSYYHYTIGQTVKEHILLEKVGANLKFIRIATKEKLKS